MSKVKSASSIVWLQRQRNDPWVKQSQVLGVRSRAYFKLLHLDDQHRLFFKNQVVIDCGAAPGGWSQYAKHKVGENGVVIGIDLIHLDPILPGVTFIHEDFTLPETKQLILSSLATALNKDFSTFKSQKPVSVVLSDMAPSFSGNLFLDRARTCDLATSALNFATTLLHPGGSFVCKILQGPESDALRRRMLTMFQKVHFNKPISSRKESAEGYLVGLGLKS
ncbi:hypothetical protein HMI54_007005 [Coelomomyces lativittatus]|nr:hypothetical protein HMI56_002571 [Coelomomyces lativittatus]KAJ1504429.1 hypothetical protein HMI54_007005 [Coelomomyces lativittatus]KAJ1508106.1 hypothetical protein HMI55_000511 [Coelomomyces lativittatus]